MSFLCFLNSRSYEASLRQHPSSKKHSSILASRMMFVSLIAIAFAQNDVTTFAWSFRLLSASPYQNQVVGNGLLSFNTTNNQLLTFNGTMFNTPMQLFQYLVPPFVPFSLISVINSACGVNYYLSNTWNSGTPYLALVGFGVSPTPVMTTTSGSIPATNYVQSNGFNQSFYYVSGTTPSPVFNGVIGNARFTTAVGCIKCPVVTPAWADSNGLCDPYICINTTSLSCGTAYGSGQLDGQFDVFLPPLIVQQDTALPSVVNRNVTVPTDSNITISTSVQIYGNMQLDGVVNIDAGATLFVNGTATVTGTVVLFGNSSVFVANNLKIAPQSKLDLIVPSSTSSTYVVATYTSVSGSFALNATLATPSSCSSISSAQPVYGQSSLSVIVTIQNQCSRSDSSGLTTGQLVGIIVGACVGGILVALAIVLIAKLVIQSKNAKFAERIRMQEIGSQKHLSMTLAE